MIAAAEESEVSTVRDSDIPVLVKRAWQTAITEAAVKRAFMECGTLPGHSDIIHALRESSQQVSIHNAYDFDGLSNVGGGRATSLLPEVDDYANSIWALHTVNQPGKTDLDRRNKGKRVHTDVGEMLTAEDALARRDAKEQSVEATRPAGPEQAVTPGSLPRNGRISTEMRLYIKRPSSVKCNASWRRHRVVRRSEKNG